MSSRGKALLTATEVILKFNPLEELASESRELWCYWQLMSELQPGEEADEDAIKQRLSKPPTSTPRRVKLKGAAPVALGNGLLTRAKAEVGTFTTIKAEAEDVKPVLPPDIKPDISADVKPAIPPDAKPVLPGTQAKAEPLDNPADIKSSSLLRAADAPPKGTSTVDDQAVEEVNGDEDEDEEEDYGQDDYVVAPWGQSRPSQLVNDEESEEEVYSEDEVEEVYSEDEHNCESRPSLWLTAASLNTISRRTQSLPESLASQSQTQSLVAVGSKVLAVKERPPFPCTEEQRLIGPYHIDPDDPSIAIPASINRFLREYQRVGVDFFYTRYKRGYGGVLGDDMG